MSSLTRTVFLLRQSRTASIIIFAAVCISCLFAMPAAAVNQAITEGELMSDASMVSLLSQSLGGDEGLALIAWEGMTAEEKGLFRDDAAKLVRIYKESPVRFENLPSLRYQLYWMKAGLVSQAWMHEVAENADFSDKKLREYYAANIGRYKKNSMVKYRQIVCSSETDARVVYSALSSARADFADLAESSSLDPRSAANGGDMGWVSRDRLKSDVAALLFELPVNQISVPTRIDNYWVIYEVLARDEGKTIIFEQCREQVMTDMFYDSLIN